MSDIEQTSSPQESERYPEGWTVEETADAMGIAQENLTNETIRGFVRLVNDAENLQMRLLTLTTDRGVRSLKTLDPGGWNKHDKDPELYNRYIDAQDIMRAVVMILKGAVSGVDTDPKYIESKISEGISRYKLKVVPMQEGIDYPPDYNEDDTH